MIKKWNEDEKLKIVNEARERLFQEGLDEVRMVNNKAKELKTQIEREI